jgi:hypothetical protein
MTEELRCAFCSKATEWYGYFHSPCGSEKLIPLCPPCLKTSRCQGRPEVISKAVFSKTKGLPMAVNSEHRLVNVREAANYLAV